MGSNNNICSIKIKRVREQSFAKTRNPYKRYQKSNFIWDIVFDEIDSLKSGAKKEFFSIISKKYGINYKTLKNKYCEHKITINEHNNINKNIEHKSNQKINHGNRGGSNKVFTEIDENEIFMFLKANFIDRNKMSFDDITELYAIDKCSKLYPNKKFNASNGWCYMFKKRWKLSTIKCTISRNATKIYNDAEIIFFE